MLMTLTQSGNVGDASFAKKQSERERGRGNERDTRKYLFIKAHTNENILFSELISKNSKEKNGTKFMTSNLEKSLNCCVEFTDFVTHLCQKKICVNIR